MKISVVNENELVKEIQSAKKESLGSIGAGENESIFMGVVTVNSGIDKVMIGEKTAHHVESIAIPVKNENNVTQTISEPSNQSSISLSNLKNKLKLNKSKKTPQNKKDGKIGL